MSVACVRPVAREAPGGAKDFLAMYLQHHGGNPKGDPERANEGATHDTRGKARFQKKSTCTAGFG